MNTSQSSGKIGPIDAVYTWVNGSDSAWQEARTKYSLEYQSRLTNQSANTEYRYRDRNELKYSLRSLYQFAPFVNHIYIVTNGQRPEWLKEHPQVTVVTHQEIFPQKNDLPTFNSQAIEANLHRIPNLSEKFIYFNDDFFLGRGVFPEDFFTTSGKIRVCTSFYLAPTGAIVPGEDAYFSAWKNTQALLTREFGKHIYYQLVHIPYALTKSLLQEAEERFPDIFTQVSSHKFRLSSDFTVTNGLIQYFAIYTGKGVYDKTSSFMTYLEPNRELMVGWFNQIKEYRYRFFCIGDKAGEDNKAVNEALQEFFNSYFPQPAPWEI